MSTTDNSLQENIFDLLKFGISKRYDAEQKETIVIRDPAVQHETNDAGSMQQMGTTQKNAALASMPDWAKYGLIGGLGLFGATLLLKAAK